LVLRSILPTNQTIAPSIAGAGCPIPSIPNQNFYKVGPLLGKAECDIAANGLIDIIQDPNVCSNTNAVLVQKQNRICDTISSLCDSQQCISSVASETKTCGKVTAKRL
jgi:hypothetical protein